MSSNADGTTGIESIKADIDQERKNAANQPTESVGGDSPRIIGNEILVKPQNKTSEGQHTDDLFSLEREIAKIHNVDESAENVHVNLAHTSSSPCGDNAESNGDTIIVASNSLNTDEKEASETNYEVKVNTIALGETALDHEDLIAVLKGLDDGNATDADLIEGVTIEGEGEYQIMEVVDDDTTEVEVSPPLSPLKSGNSSKSFGAAVLTTEEERALALEQMANIDKGRNKQRKRKQDIKPMQQIDPVVDLVSSLEADWTDNDDDGSRENVTTNKKESPVPVQIIESKLNVPQITSVVVIPPSSDKRKSSESMVQNSTSADKKENISKENESKEAVSTSSPIEGVIVTKTNEEPQILSSHTGFRRTRIIKRKIIWDPDAPETTFSYAKLVTSSNKNKSKTESPTLPTSTITKGSTTIKPVKKEVNPNIVRKTQRPATPKENKLDSTIGKKSIASQRQNNKKEEVSESKTPAELVRKSSSPSASDLSPNNNKRRSLTPVTNGPAATKKKKVSEIDRLMGDEGAVNMINSLEKLGTVETKSARPMMRSRAATICERLPRKESISPVKTPPPTTTSPQTPRSGKRTPKPRASSGWDYVYKQKQQNIDDSMIIRRRSNSSYSSTASLNRLSLDGPSTPGNTTKSQDVKSTTSTPGNVTPKADSKTPDDTASQGKRAGANSKNSPKSFEFAKPENKKTQRRTKSPATGTLTSDLKKPAPAANKRTPHSPTSTLDDEQKDVGNSPKTVPTATAAPAKEKAHTSDVIVKKSSKLAQIIFSTNKAKLSCTFTAQMLNKLSDILDKMANDSDTNVTVILTNDTHFCQGVDLTELAAGSAEKRKTIVKMRYLVTLASYPKPLIAGVNGHLMNLGVMQLLFFDVVVAGDKSTYETSYTRIGQLPESYGVWNKLNKIRGSFKTKLFWLSEKVQSTEAALAGLVNKLTSGAKVNEEAINIGRKMASMPAESYRSMKNTVTQCYLEAIEETFDEEFTTIAEQWLSSECVEQIKKIIDQGHF
ncbi:mucin-5AC-like [Musca domestica]|uniref:Mucin-5AC-like n=1 Tax=Musca domestica TaxID=7370 RepID=A0ABM3VPB1_MUSDO|nr:mucin-5AC-like [Musca domestica]